MTFTWQTDESRRHLAEMLADAEWRCEYCDDAGAAVDGEGKPRHLLSREDVGDHTWVVICRFNPDRPLTLDEETAQATAMLATVPAEAWAELADELRRFDQEHLVGLATEEDRERWRDTIRRLGGTPPE